MPPDSNRHAAIESGLRDLVNAGILIHFDWQDGGEHRWVLTPHADMLYHFTDEQAAAYIRGAVDATDAR